MLQCEKTSKNIILKKAYESIAMKSPPANPKRQKADCLLPSRTVVEGRIIANRLEVSFYKDDNSLHNCKYTKTLNYTF